MHSLEQIISMNNKAARKAPSATCDHSSYTGTIENGIVIHSGKHRETRLLRGDRAKLFVRDWLDLPASCRTQHGLLAKRDTLVESYF